MPHPIILNNSIALFNTSQGNIIHSTTNLHVSMAVEITYTC